MRLWIHTLAAIACAGCTMNTLSRHSLSQLGTVTDTRYREVVENLALIAHNASSLPAYSSIYAGTATVTDTGTVGSTTMWQHVIPTSATSIIQNGFMSEAVSPQVSRQVIENWTLDPIVVPEKLEVFRGMCQWVLYGPESVSKETLSLLASPDQAPGPGRHFGVLDQLQRLPAGWLHAGKAKDVPLNACYRANCCDAWVWIMPDGMKGLADFTIIVQSVARLSINSPSLFNAPVPIAVLPFELRDSPGPAAGCVLIAAVNLDPCGRLAPAQRYLRYRLDNVVQDANLRAQINAAASH